MPRFAFQQSKIWEAGDPIDPNGYVKSVKGKSEPKARRRLPNPGTGRVWVLTGKKRGSDG